MEKRKEKERKRKITQKHVSKGVVVVVVEIFSPGVNQLLGVNQLFRVTPKCW